VSNAASGAGTGISASSSWRGYLMAFFALVWVANLYMSIFGRLRLDIKNQRVEIAEHEKAMEPELPAVASLSPVIEKWRGAGTI
jgi:hypothetical protein